MWEAVFLAVTVLCFVGIMATWIFQVTAQDIYRWLKTFG
jgi:hypothetical protein